MVLLQSDARCIETVLKTHDLSVPISAYKSPGQHITNDRTLRILLLTASSVGHSDLVGTVDRIERLSVQYGGVDVLIVFVMQSPPLHVKNGVSNTNAALGRRGSVNGSAAYSQLQIAMLDRGMAHALPVLPIAHLSGFANTIKTHLKAANLPSVAAPKVTESLQLLPTCAVDSRMSQFGVNLTTDCFSSLRHLATEASHAQLSEHPEMERPGA